MFVGVVKIPATVKLVKLQAVLVFTSSITMVELVATTKSVIPEIWYGLAINLFLPVTVNELGVTKLPSTSMVELTDVDPKLEEVMVKVVPEVTVKYALSLTYKFATVIVLELYVGVSCVLVAFWIYKSG